MIATMVLVGGLTRLTESGLSIVEWKPVTGAIPPLHAEAWQDEFTKYQQTPEYIKKNSSMTLAEFKAIFLWEYTHRLIGRLVGFVFFLPFVYFLLKRRISRRYAWQFTGIFLLGGLQGVIGWYMVKSGLVDRPDVSQYRLTLHLGTAFLLYALIFWTALTLLNTAKERLPLPGWFKGMALLLPIMVFIQVLSGGFVAGLDAGLVYNTFPSMNGMFAPPELFSLNPWYKNLLENVTTVQFNHRIWAILTASATVGFWGITQYLPSLKSGLTLRQKNLINALLMVLVLQFSLGVATLLHAVPLTLASLHQMGALVLFTVSLAVAHSTKATAQGAV